VAENGLAEEGWKGPEMKNEKLKQCMTSRCTTHV